MSTFEELVEILANEAEPSYSRRSAISALGRLGDERAIEPLVSALQDKDRYLRREAAKALGELGSSAAIGPLIKALEDSEEYVRRSAITALGVLGDARAIEPLEQMLEDQSFFTRSESEKSLRKIEERIKESALAKEREAELESSSSATAEVETAKVVPPAQEDTVEEEPEILPLPAALPTEEASAAMLAEEAVTPEVPTSEDSSAELMAETKERIEQLAEVEQARRGLHAVREFTDAEERLIQAQVSEDSRGVILIRFEKDGSLLQSPSFCPGDVMQGTMLLHVAKPFKARGIYLSVKGKEEVEWKTKEIAATLRGSGVSSTTYHDEYPIIDETVPVIEGQCEIQPGNYEYPFAFRIPENSTPSYRGEICACEYSVSAYIDVALRRDVKSERSFRVSRLPMDRERQMKGISFSTTHAYHDITLSVTLQDAIYTIGSRVKGAIIFQNHTKKRIRGIDVGLFYQEFARCRYRKLFDSGMKRKLIELQTDTIRISVPEESIREFQTGFSLRIPSSASETGSRHLFDADAFVKVNLDVAREFDVSCSHRIDILPTISP